MVFHGAMDSPEQLERERDEVRAGARRQLVAILIAVGAMVLAGALALVLLGDDDDDVDAGASTTSTSVAGPDGGSDTTMAGSDLYPGLSEQHPLVGRSELEARETYPVVRVTWLDGEALMTTMDLVPGRVNVAIDGGVVMAAAAEGCEEVDDSSPMWARQACAPSEADGPASFGRLIEGEAGTLVLEPGLDAERYYEGVLVAPRDELPVLVDTTGAPVTQDELQAGQSVWLWIGGPCAESFPVQCELDAVLVER